MQLNYLFTHKRKEVNTMAPKIKVKVKKGKTKAKGKRKAAAKSADNG